MRSDQTEPKRSDQELKLAQLELKITELNDKIKLATEKLENEIFPQLKTKIMSRTKWSSALEVWSPKYDGSGVKALIETRIKPDRLDENDLNALEAWADVLSTNNSQLALEATEELCRFIANYYPENERTTQRLYFAYKALKNNEQKAR